ncbi:restriction endonuclease subunit S [Vibrio cholerae]|nr:restriction endonuclease subunit S [Vibrio cholerae]
MGNDWPIVKLGDYCKKIGSGATPKGGSSVYLDLGDVCLIRSQNIYNEGFSESGLVYIDDIAATKLKNVEVEKNDVLLNITGDSVARVCLAPSDFLPARVNQHVAIIRPNAAEFDARFLRYLLASPKTQKLLLNLASAGATRNALTKGMIEDFEVSKPPVSVQTGIANLLESLDNKITLNHQINQTLEQMAQALFKSWFVDFDPVIDNALDAGNPIPDELQHRAEARKAVRESEGFKPLPDDVRQLFPDAFEESELGWVPKGWETKPISSLINLIGGGTPKTSEESYWGGEIPWFSVVDAPNDSNVFVLDTEKKVTEAGVANSSTKVLRVGTTIISARGTVGKCALVATPMAMNQSCYGVVGAEGVHDYFVYYLLRQSVKQLQQRSHGSVFSTITRDTFSSLKLATGNVSLTQLFGNTISPWFEKILANNQQQSSLERLRDTLLPKLISGELRLDDVELAVEQEAVSAEQQNER